MLSNAKAELARLQAVEAAHIELQRQNAQTLRLIAGTPQFFERLTKVAGPQNDGNSTAGTPTADGQSWQVDFALMTLLIVPKDDEIQLVDKSNIVPLGRFKLASNGSISATTQTLVLGYAERIVRAAADGADPVSEALSLIGEVTATA